MSKPDLKISKIAVVFMVQNLERTRRFYSEALGLELVLNEDYLLGTLAGGTELLFFVGEAVRGTSPQIVPFPQARAAGGRPCRGSSPAHRANR